MPDKLLSLTEITSCPVQYVLAINDTMNALRGKWKLPLITALLHETKRFGDLQRDLPRIMPRILAKELRELELNSIVERRVHDTIPVLIEYQLTPSAYALKHVLDQMIVWGIAHQARVFGPSAAKGV
jgi:DNA-binding HxlR family transcriptional regulator